MEEQAPVLTLRGVSKTFGALTLFRNVGFSLSPGTLSILAGGNGAGKSTLMRIMAGLSKPDAGTVECGIPPEATGYMAHETFLYPALTAMENLLFWAKAAGLESPENAAISALKTVGLSKRAEERAGVFSRGMAQRLNLARLIMAEPKLILLDEPSTGLDVSSRALLHELIDGFRSKGSAIVWISHDLEEDARFADAVLMLRKKTLVVNERSIQC